jgi:hypothetical protein
MSTHDDDDIRTLLEDAVADVEPRHGLEELRARTGSRSGSRRPWIWGAGGAMLATAATITAFAVFNDAGTTDAEPPVAGGPSGAVTTADTPSDAPTTQGPSDPASEPTGDATGPAVPVYYVGDTSRGPRLFREFHRLPGASALNAALGAAVGQDLDGNQLRPDDPDYRTDWPALTAATGSFDGIGDDGQITIDLGGDPESSLHDRPAGMTEQEAEVAVQQLVYTAQGVTQTTAPVQFLLFGDRTDSVLGVPTSEPLGRASADDVLAQVWINSPAEGATLPSGFTAHGLANAFEANVQWELKQGETVVKEGFTSAKQCCTMAMYSFPVEAPPGDYTLVVHDSDPSGGEGFAPWQDTKDITITR